MTAKIALVLAAVASVVLAGCGGGGSSLTVTSVSPAADATGVAVTSAITATFDRAIDDSTISSTTFTLSDASGSNVAGTVTYDADTFTATFTPTFPLTNWMTYTANVTTGVNTSLSSAMTKAALDSNYTWQFTAISRKVLYSSGRALDGSDAQVANDTTNIWSIEADGSNNTPLTSITVADNFSRNPQWSPDGTKIAFQSERALDGSNDTNANGTDNIWVMDADGSNPTPLTSLTAVGAQCTVPQWSRDGTKILYRSARALDGSNAVSANDNENIWVINADGTGDTPLTQLTASDAICIQGIWSPDGTQIAFISTRALNGVDTPNENATTNVWVMDADGSNPSPLTNMTSDQAESFVPAWSPDGTQIAFASARALDGTDTTNTNTAYNIWVIDADGSNPTPVTSITASSNAGCVYPSWSPDGLQIGFTSGRKLDGSNAANDNDTANIWSVNADGTGATPLTSLTAADALSAFSQWLPDGSKILYVSWRALNGSNAANTNPTSNVWVMDADGSSPLPLTVITADGADSSEIGL